MSLLELVAQSRVPILPQRIDTLELAQSISTRIVQLELLSLFADQCSKSTSVEDQRIETPWAQHSAQIQFQRIRSAFLHLLSGSSSNNSCITAISRRSSCSLPVKQAGASAIYSLPEPDYRTFADKPTMVYPSTLIIGICI